MGEVTKKENSSTGWTRVYPKISFFGILYFGLTILILSLLTTDYNPISQVASDYGVGRYAIEMDLGFVMGGVGLISFALVVAQRRISRAGALLLFVDGLALLVDGFFATNVEGASATLHGTIHGFGGAIFFFTAPIGILLVFYRLGQRRFLLTLVGFIIGVLFFVANDVFSLNATGLAERVLLLVIFSSVIIASQSLFPTRFPEGSWSKASW